MLRLVVAALPLTLQASAGSAFVLTAATIVQSIGGDGGTAIAALRDGLAGVKGQLAAHAALNQTVVADWSLGLGGHVRTGLEDNVRVSRDRLAASNAELVRIAAQQVARHGGRPATAAEARALLGLRPA